jgi:predicted SAM-dependent methyltransferase
MKAQIRKVVRKVANWPGVGRFVRIGVAIIRLPEFRAEYLARNTHLASNAAPVTQLLANLDHRGLFEEHQLPTLLQAVADINQRQLSSDNDRDNLVKSAPLALRKLTREMKTLQDEWSVLQAGLQQRLDSLRDTLQTQADASRDELQSQFAASRDELRGQIEAGNAELQGRIDSGNAELQGKIDSGSAELRAQMEGATQWLQRLESEARGDVGTLKESVSYLLGRVEFVRRELMFEMRYGASAPGGGEDSLKADTAILSADKLEAARRESRVRLNLGCGHIALDGYLNVDRRALPGVDIVAEVDQLPFEANQVDEIFSAHLLEHFPQEQLVRQLLPYYHSLIKNGGQFHAVVPDAEAMIHAYSNGGYPYEDMREVLYGGQDYDGDFHFNMFTPESLSKMLTEAGFATPTIVASGRKNGRCYEFEISAVKP